MRRITIIFLSFLFALSLLPVTAIAEQNAVWCEFYVSVDGNDDGDGSLTSPFQTIDRARLAVREVSNDMQGDIIVHILSGTYYLDDILRFRTEDSGKNGYKVIYRGEDKPVISGGVNLGKFTRSEEYPHLWELKAPDISHIRFLSIDGTPANIAAADKEIYGTSLYEDDDPTFKYDGMYISSSDIGIYENPEDVEFQWFRTWKVNTAKVENILPNPVDPSQLIVRMQQGWWDYIGPTVNDDLAPGYEYPFLVLNAFELLDAPGEFYFNRKTKTLYYMPREGEDIQTVTAVVPKPRFDCLMQIIGSDYDAKVKNLCFEGLVFANTDFAALTLSPGIRNNQGASWFSLPGTGSRVPEAIYVNYASGLTFEGCHFRELGGTGMLLYNGVDNAVIRGNVFSDIGGTSVIMGNEDQTIGDRSAPPADKDAPVNLIVPGAEGLRTYFYSSYVRTNVIRKWIGDPRSEQTGEKQWIMYDLGDSYTLSEIKVSYVPELGTGYKPGFEVLLSNDFEFKDYELAGTVSEGGKQDEYSIIPGIEAQGKFRYVMVRALKPGNFAVNYVEAYTKDIKSHTIWERNSDCEISNNYIIRTGTVAPASALLAYYVNRHQITHNEIIGNGYSGIQIGWGWSNRLPSWTDNYIAGNYVDDTNRTLHDGGAIYYVSNGSGSVIENNYSRSINLTYSTFYGDSGIAHIKLRNNVSGIAMYNYFLQDWLGAEQMRMVDVSMENIFGVHTTDYGTSAKKGLTTLYNPLNPAPNVRKIINEAGLQAQYRHIRDWTTDRADYWTYTERRAAHFNFSLSAFVSALDKMVLNMQSTDNYGIYPWNTPYEVYDMINEASRIMDCAVKESDSSKQANLAVYVRELLVKALECKPSYTLEEMIAYAETMLNNAVPAEGATDKWNTSPQTSIDTLRSAIEAAKVPYATGESETSRLDVLEKACAAFINAKNSADLSYVSATGMKEAVIDKENKTVTLIFPSEEKLKVPSLKIFTEGNAVVGGDFSKDIDLSVPLTIPVYSKNLNKYTMWTINSVVDKEESAKWLTNTVEDKNIIAAEDGIYLRGRISPYMYSERSIPGALKNFDFIPYKSAEVGAFSVILGAEKADSFLPEIDRHLRLDINNRDCTLWLVDGATITRVASLKVNVNWNELNTIGLRFSEEGSSTRAEVFLNDSNIVNVLVPNTVPTNGYSGFVGDLAGIRVLDVRN